MVLSYFINFIKYGGELGFFYRLNYFSW